MTSILSAASSGLKHYQAVIDVAANNVANVNTPAFKRSRAISEGAPGDPALGAVPRLGVGVTTLDVFHGPAAAQPFDDPLAFAVTGRGFVRVLGFEGEPLYTRFGRLEVGADGSVAINGHLVDPAITIPADYSAPAVDENGIVSALSPEGEREALGQLSMAGFVNPEGLEVAGGGFYRATANSGGVTEELGDGTFATLATGSLETSNVELTSEFATMLIAQRAYQASLRTFRVGDDMLALAADVTQ